MSDYTGAMNLTRSMKDFVLHWGEMGTRWGVNRTVAQVHALLYLSPEPLDAEEIAETLSVARSNVSTSLRELQNWNLVHLVPRMGERRDRFHTSHDLWELFLTVVEQRVEREIAPTIEFLGELHEWYGQMKKLPAATLRSLMRVGTGLTKWLPTARRGGAR